MLTPATTTTVASVATTVDATDFRNNIVASNGTWAISGRDSNFGAGLLAACAFAANGSGSCSACRSSSSCTHRSRI